MLRREGWQCNLNSDDIYCQGVLVHGHPVLCGLTQHQQALGSGETQALFTVHFPPPLPRCPLSLWWRSGVLFP